MDTPSTNAMIHPMTRGQQIRSLMLELNISYNAARCRLDPEYHEKQKEYSRQYAAKKKQESVPKECTRAYQIRTVMTEQDLSYHAARCRIDPEFHTKQKEYKNKYSSKRYQEDEEFRKKVQERTRIYQAKPSTLVPKS